MTPIEVLKMLQSKIDEAKFYKTNYVLQTNDIEMIAEALRIHDVVGRSEELQPDEEANSCKRCQCDWIELKDKTSVCKVCFTQCPF
jgi:hypothetical protein